MAKDRPCLDRNDHLQPGTPEVAWNHGYAEMISREEVLRDQALAQSMFPGKGHIDILRAIHRFQRPKRYLEIGVGHGFSLALAAAPTQTFGVDPNPRVSSKIKNPDTKIFVGESDTFFAQLGALPKHVVFDLVFVDGLHHFEQTLRDIHNAEKHSHRDTLICCHDIHPIHAKAANRQRINNHWAGDVWKILPVLLKHRPDLSLAYMPCFPSGLLLITGLDPDSQLLSEAESDYTAEYMEAPFEQDAFEHLLRRVPRVNNTIKDVVAYLRERLTEP